MLSLLQKANQKYLQINLFKYNLYNMITCTSMESLPTNIRTVWSGSKQSRCNGNSCDFFLFFGLSNACDLSNREAKDLPDSEK